MSIASALTALQGDITAARAAVTAKGGTVSSGGGSSQLATDIATIPTGGSPTGSLAISENGTYDVTQYASAVVNINKVPQLIYQRVEYLQSTGSQYINSWKNNVNGVDIEFAYTSLEGSVFGARDSDDTNRFGLTVYDGFHVMPPGYSVPGDTARHRLQMGAKFGWDVLLDGVLQYNSQDHSFSSYRTLLFAENISGYIGLYASAKIYGCKLYTDNALVCEMIPCYRRSDNKPGMYFATTGEFVTNSGTGEFTVGGDV